MACIGEFLKLSIVAEMSTRRFRGRFHGGLRREWSMTSILNANRDPHSIMVPKSAIFSGLLMLCCLVGSPAGTTAAETGGFERKPMPNDRSFDALFGPNREHRYFENADVFPFHPTAERFDLANAWWLAESSMLVYVNDATFVAKQFAAAGLDHVRLFSSTAESTHDTQGLIAYNDQFAIVAMRGTEPNRGKDFLTDLNVLHAEAGDGGQVHVGFKSALADVWESMEPLLRSLHQEGRTIWFTGHSLGAALAVLAADHFGDAAGVYTFGSPRVGDARFKVHYRQPTYRIVNNTDLVTELPPPLLYRHVGELKYFASDHRLFEGIEGYALLRDRAKGRMNAAMSQLGQWADLRFEAIPPKDLQDHAPIHYVTLCWNQLLEQER